LIASHFLAVAGSLAAAHASFDDHQRVEPNRDTGPSRGRRFFAQLPGTERAHRESLKNKGELGLTKWAEVAVFKGFKPNELIFGTELGLLQREPYLLSVGFANWSPHSHVAPQPFIEAGYYTEHNKLSVGRPMSVIATKRSSVMPTISIRPGAPRSIFRVARAIHPRLVSPAI
jgi:hypothetical protein